MNSLSWMLYFIGLASSIPAGLVPVLIISSIISGAIVAGTVIYQMEIGEDSSGIRNRTIFWYLIFAVPSFLILILMPTRQTMIMIAASEVGEKVISSQKVQDIIDPSTDLLKTYIQNELRVQKERFEKK